MVRASAGVLPSAGGASRQAAGVERAKTIASDRKRRRSEGVRGCVVSIVRGVKGKRFNGLRRVLPLGSIYVLRVSGGKVEDCPLV